MIEKLKTLEDDEIDMSVGAVNTRFADTELVKKINELVDAVNELQERVDDHDQAFDDCARDITKTETMLKNINTIVGSLITDSNIHEKQIDKLKTEVNKMAENLNFAQSEVKENMQDKFSEQRKWVGKLCRFWDDADKPENCVYDILCNIFDITHHEDCPFQCGNGEWYEYCEPVKPDDDIIFKGE